MKHALLIGWLLLAARLGTAAPTPADTVKGQAQFVRQLSASLCEHLTAESQKTDLSKLSADETQQLFSKLMLGALADHMDAFQAVLKQLGPNTQGKAEALGQDAVLQLVDNCPPARTFLAQMGLKASQKDINIAPAERPVLLPVAQAICHRLDEENAKQAFSKMTPEARAAKMESAMQTIVMTNAQELADYYGEDTVDNQQQMKEIGTKIGLLVFEQCPSYIMLVGRDQQRATSAAKPAAPAARPAPARRPAPKAPAKK